MEQYAPNDEAQVAELGEMFKQTMQNVYTVFGEQSGRLYSVSEESSNKTGGHGRKNS